MPDPDLEIRGGTRSPRPLNKGGERSLKQFFGPSGLSLVLKKGGPGPPGPSPGSATASFYVVIQATRSAVQREYLNFSITWRSEYWSGSWNRTTTSHSAVKRSADRANPAAVQDIIIARIRWFSYREIEYSILTFNPRCPVGPGGPDGPGRPYSNDKENDCKNSTFLPYKPKPWKNIFFHMYLYIFLG